MATFLWVALAGKGTEPPPFRDKKIYLLIQRGRAEAYVAKEIKVLCIYKTSTPWHLCTYYIPVFYKTEVSNFLSSPNTT